MFGQLVRGISGNRIFQYPDEIDPSQWKKAVLLDNIDAPSSTARENGSALKEARSQHPASTNHTGSDEKNVLIVGWYGSDDPEVS